MRALVRITVCADKENSVNTRISVDVRCAASDGRQPFKFDKIGDRYAFNGHVGLSYVYERRSESTRAKVCTCIYAASELIL
jgi:hypothetical protein